MGKLYLSKLVFFLLLLFVVVGSSASNSLRFNKGVLDIRGYDLKELNNIGFDGEWEFYWGQLLKSDNFDNQKNDTIAYIHVPSVWTSYEIDGIKLPSCGCATYRAIVLKDSTQSKLAIKLGNIGTAFNLFIDGVEVCGAGGVALDKDYATPGYSPGVVNFTSLSDSVEIIFHISNYHYSKGGLWNNFNQFGTEDNIRKSWNNEILISILLLGVMLIMAFYNLTLFFLNRNFVYTLLFSLFCLIIVVRTSVLDEMLLFEYFPTFNWITLVKIEYLTLTLGSVFFTLFVYYFFKDKVARVLLSFIVVVDIIFSLLILFTPPIVFTRFLLAYQGFILLGFTYALIITLRALFQKNKSATIMALGLSIFIAAVVNDIFYANKLIDTMYVSSFGFVSFVFSQAYMMSRHFSTLYYETKSLTEDLKVTNINLEEKVDKRTSEIQDQNRLMQKQQSVILLKNRKLDEYNEKLEQQRDDYKSKHKIVENQKVEITSSIVYARRIQEAVLETGYKIGDVAPDSFVISHPKDIVSGDFYWFKEVEISGKQYKIIAVVDCTGHGVPGAFMSILGTMLLNKIVNEFNSKPKASEILDLMRIDVKSLLHNQLDGKSVSDGMDMALVIVDYETMQIQFAGAHNPIFLIRNINGAPSTEVEQYKGDNMPIGIYQKERKNFVNNTIDIKNGDLFYLFSDGYYDQFGGEYGKRLMKKNFKEMLLSVAHMSMSKQKISLEVGLLKWRGDNEQIDDVTVVGVRV